MNEEQLRAFAEFLERFGANSKDLNDIYEKSGKSAEKFQKEIDKLTKDAKKQKATYDDLKKKIDELNDSIEDLDETTDAAEIAVKKSMKAELAKTAATKMAEEATKKYADATSKATKDILGRAAQGTAQFVKNLQDDASGTQLSTDLMTAGIDMAGSAAKGAGKLLSTFGDVAMAAGVETEGLGFIVGGAAKILGSALDASSESMTKLAKFGVEILSKEVEKTYKAFNQMSASGALFTDGMTGMRNAAGDAGLTIEQMSNVVKASSEKIASAGISVTEGTKMLGRVGKALKESGAQEQLLKLGYGFEEQVGLMADVTKQMRITGKTVTDKNVQDATQKYAENLRLIASITGEDAKKKMEVAEQASKELIFRQELAKKSPEQQAAIQQAMTSMTDLELKNFKDRVASHGAVINEEGAMYEAQVRGAKDKASELYAAWESNTLTYKKGADLNAKYGETINKSILSNQGLARAGYFADGAIKDLSASMSKQIDANNQYTKAAVDGAEAGVTQKDANDDLTKSVTGAEEAAQDLKKALQQELTPAIAKFAEVSKAMLSQVQDMLADLGIKTHTPGIAKENRTAAMTQVATGENKAEGVGASSTAFLKQPNETQAEYEKRIRDFAATQNANAAQANKPSDWQSDYMKSVAKHDKGGAIGVGKLGIAGENGPELISGPSSVLSTVSTGKLLDVINAMKLQSGNLTGDDGMDKTVVNSPVLQAEIAKQLQGFNQTATSPVTTNGPSSVLSNATVESLVTAIDAMREMKGQRFGENDYQPKVSMNEDRWGVIKDRMKGFEGFDVNQLQEEFMKRPEADPIKKVYKQWDDEERGDVSSAEATAHLAEIARLMKQNVDHTARVAANTN